jgi:ribulose-5-phosphate 4-epimerase/fuculose-1-phosphate aldolase
MPGHHVRDDLARVCRVLAHHRMIDLWGHLSLRVPKSNVVLVTPKFSRTCLPRTITAADMLVCSMDGRVVEGSGELELPLQFATDIALYRDAGAGRSACIFASPHATVAAGMAHRSLLPLTHMESPVGHGLATWESAELATGNRAAAALAALIAGATAVQQPGIGAWSAGADIYDALMNLYHLEYLAQANVVSAGESTMQTLHQADWEKLWRQFSGHAHYVEFFDALDPGVHAHPYDTFLARHTPGRAPHEALKAQIAFSCRALWERDTLVAFLEHISHRLPEENRFLMTAAKIYRDMEPSDLCLLDYDANWIDGPKPPGFKWFHAQLLKERRDAQAVCHTHDLYGRVYALSARTPASAYRLGLDIATRRLPLYGRCDLIVDADVRRATLDALGSGPVVHEVGHGTDFVAPTLEQSTVDAIQREAFLAMDHLAQRFGGARPLPDALIAQLHAAEATAEDWWWFYAAEVGAPRRSAAGL